MQTLNQQTLIRLGEQLRAVREVKPAWVVAENVRGLLARKKGVALETVCVDLENEGYTMFPPFIIPACSKGAPHRRDRVWIIAYSDSNGCELQSRSGGRKAKKSEIKENKWQWIRHEFTRNALSTPVANPNPQKLERRPKSGGIISKWKKGRQFIRGYDNPTYWEKFPIESPISNRNDGIPSRLVRYSDGTDSGFNEKKVKSRLRKEGIKGSGNAISPQIAFEIFKAIEDTMNLMQNHTSHP